MPFDSAADPTALYRERREKAAALWRTLVPSQFNLQTWECGTTACAIGWLAVKRHDGWTFDDDGAPVWGACGESFDDAASYFGLTDEMTEVMFGNHRPAREFYGVDDIRKVTPEMVATKLLAQPITVHGDTMQETSDALR